MPYPPKQFITDGIDKLYETATHPLTQAEIADFVGCSRTQIRNIEQSALKKLQEGLIERGVMPQFNGTREAKHATKAPHAKEYLMERSVPVFDEDKYYQEIDFRYSSAFKGYMRMIESMLKRAKTALSIRELHILLGVHANPRFTADALEMSDHVIIFQLYPVDKFLWHDGQKTMEKVQRCWNGSHVFERAEERLG